MSNENRQPAGVPVGGQFATGPRAENGTELPAPDEAFPEDYRGTCRGCERNVGMTDDNRVVHLDENYQPIDDNDEDLDEPEFDPYTYDGGDVTAVAEASGWGGSAWEHYQDAREEAALADAHTRGKASVTGGIDMTGPASDIRESAQKAMWRAETIYQVAGAKALAEDILTEYPDAVYLELEESDQEGSAYVGGSILDANGEQLADMEDFEEDHWAALSDLPAAPPYTVKQNEDGTVTGEGDTRFAFLEVEGSRRRGYSGKLNLKVAAAADLNAL